MKIHKNPFTEKEMVERANKANEDYAAERVLTINELEEELNTGKFNLNEYLQST